MQNTYLNMFRFTVAMGFAVIINRVFVVIKNDFDINLHRWNLNLNCIHRLQKKKKTMLACTDVDPVVEFCL